MANIPAPPTYAEVIIIDEKTKKPIFNPQWLDWFLLISQIINQGGGTLLTHNDLNGLQGGTAPNEFYHLTQAEFNALTTLPANRLLGRGTLSGVGAAEAITLGSGISLAGTVLNAAGSGGTVTSVDVSGSTTGLTTSGGPITTSGTITIAGQVNLGALNPSALAFAASYG